MLASDESMELPSQQRASREVLTDCKTNLRALVSQGISREGVGKSG